LRVSKRTSGESGGRKEELSESDFEVIYDVGMQIVTEHYPCRIRIHAVHEDGAHSHHVESMSSRH